MMLARNRKNAEPRKFKFGWTKKISSSENDEFIIIITFPNASVKTGHIENVKT